jgi:hypothetical protein
MRERVKEVLSKDKHMAKTQQPDWFIHRLTPAQQAAYDLFAKIAEENGMDSFVLASHRYGAHAKNDPAGPTAQAMYFEKEGRWELVKGSYEHLMAPFRARLPWTREVNR